MRFILILFLLIVNIPYINGQYTFTNSTGNYQNLTGSTSLNNGNVWTNTSSYPLNLGFNFTVNSQNYTSINVMAGGGIAFAGFGNYVLRVFNHSDSGYLLGDRGTTSSQSNISYKTVGSLGQRILKIEWNNAGFRDWCSTAPVDTNDFVNFQVWLFENDNHLEVHFGNSFSTLGSYGNPNCNTGSDGTQFFFTFDNCNNSLSLSSNANNPSYAFIDHCIWQPGQHVNGTPQSGVIYIINPNTTGIKKKELYDFVIFPNPASESITIENTALSISSLTLIDSFGKVIIQKNDPNGFTNKIQLSLSNLSVGIYLIQISTKDGITYTKKISLN